MCPFPIWKSARRVALALCMLFGSFVFAITPIHGQTSSAQPAATAQGAGSPAAPPDRVPVCAEANCLRVLATGGFLGFIDGFPDHPGWPGDTISASLAAELQDSVLDTGPTVGAAKARSDKPKNAYGYGGVLGVHAWLGDTEGARRLLVVTGNNHPQQVKAAKTPEGRRAQSAAPAPHWFWGRIAALNAAAVAVGGEDMHRWIAEMTPEDLTRWVLHRIRGTNGDRLPFVASNVVIRKSGSGLNVMHDAAARITLDVAEKESVGWLAGVTLSHPCSIGATVKRAAFTFEGTDVPTVEPEGADALDPREAAATDATQAAPAARARGGKAIEVEDVCKTKLTFSSRLRPGRTYRLRAVDVTSPRFEFQIVTHDVLTPHDENAGAWAGLPVIATQRAGTPIAIMAFVSPHVANELPPTFSEWTRANGCPVEKCRFDYLSPADSAAHLLAMGRGNGPTPLLIGLTDLEDEETGELLDMVPAIRMVTLKPESRILGRAADPTDDDAAQRYSGDYSFAAVVDEPHPELTRLFMRPEWIGETVLHAVVRLAPGSADFPAWRIGAPWVGAHSVPGAQLVPHVARNRTEVTYTAELPGLSVEAAPAASPRYCDVAADGHGPFDDTGLPQRDLWTDHHEFTGLVLDAMRQHVGAEMALVPELWVDASVMAWLKERVEASSPAPIDWLSGFILRRVLFRAERVVKVSLEGASVASTLEKITKQAKADQDPLCASGLGITDCPVGTLDAKNVAVNARRPVAGHYYSLVLPASLARAHELEFDEKTDTVDFLDSLDARLSKPCGAPAASASATDERSLAARLEELRASKIQHYVRLDPLSFEYSLTDVNEPPQGTGLFPKLPDDSSQAVDNRQVIIDADVDWGIIDTRRFALRVPGRVKFTRKDLADETSFDRDEYAVGLRGDYKRKMRGLARIFVGVFVEGQLAAVESEAKASRKVTVPDPARAGETLENLTVPGPTLTFHTSRRRFVYASGGLELPKYELFGGTLSEVRGVLDAGVAANVPSAIRIGSVTRDIDDFRRLGIDALVSDEYQKDLAAMTNDTPLGFEYARPTQMRAQVDVKYERPAWRKSKISGELRLRRYHRFSNESLLATNKSEYGKIAIEYPIVKRWSVAPYYELTRVDVHGIDGTFSVERVGVAIKLATFLKRSHGRLIE